MIGKLTQRIYRELAGLKEPISQAVLAQRCGCSLSFVNKEVKDLVLRRILGRPSRTRLTVVNRPALLLLWMGRRNIRSVETTVIRTNLSEKAALKRLSKVKDHAVTLETAARLMGTKENVSVDEVHVYMSPKAVKGLKVPSGDKGVTFVLLYSDDDNLYKSTTIVDGVRVAPAAQVFVDLADWGTWTAHNAAVRMAMDRDDYPVLATRQELEAFQ